MHKWNYDFLTMQFNYIFDILIGCLLLPAF